MLDYHMIIDSIGTDEAGRIIIRMKPEIAQFLTEDTHRTSLKQMLQAILKEDFLKLEVGGQNLRITVTEGKQDASIERIKDEISSALQMASSFAESSSGPIN